MRMDSTRGLRRFWSGRQIDASQCEQQSGTREMSKRCVISVHSLRCGPRARANSSPPGVLYVGWSCKREREHLACVHA